jgi:hypothetical protein
MNDHLQPIRARDEAVTWRIVDGEAIVLDQRTWAYLSMNGTGALLWQRLVAGASEPELVATLVESFELSEDQSRGDVNRFLTALREHDLLAVSG